MAGDINPQCTCLYDVPQHLCSVHGDSNSRYVPVWEKKNVMEMIEEMEGALVLLSTKENGFGDVSIEDKHWVASTGGFHELGFSYGSAESAIRSLYFKWIKRNDKDTTEFRSIQGH